MRLNVTTTDFQTLLVLYTISTFKKKEVLVEGTFGPIKTVRTLIVKFIFEKKKNLNQPW